MATKADEGQAPEAEERLRLQVAACTRLLHLEGLLDYSGHVSARVPGTGSILIQPIDDSRAEVAPDRLLLVPLEGPLPRFGQTKPPAEVSLHIEIYRSRPEVSAVAHLHTEIATLFTLVESPALQPVKLHAMRWASGIPTHPDPSHIDTPAKGQELASTLGPHQAALLRAHGSVLVAESIPALLIDAVHFEENALAQFRASSLGRLKPLTPAELHHLAADWQRDRHVAKLWKYYVRRGVEAGVLPEPWEDRLPGGAAERGKA